jgi:hypothetical protein
MKVNTAIYPILREFGIGKEDGTAYLLMKYFGYNPSYIPDALVAKMNMTGIYYMDDNNSLQWKIPLFDDQETAFDWVKTEYVELFVERNPDKRGNGNSSVRLMKKFFADNPSIRKDEVIEATKMYLKNTDPRYIRFSNYFISKGRGADKVSELAEWIDKYRLFMSNQNSREGLATTMQ